MVDLYIILTEEKINEISVRESIPPFLGKISKTDVDYKEFENIQKHAKMLSTNREDIVFLSNRLVQMGYVLKKRQGQSDHGFESVDYVRFQRDACITQSVWSRYYSGVQSRTSQDTLLKLVIGMHLNKSEAMKFMALAGSGFAHTDFRDMIILSVIMNNYFDLDDPVEVTSMVFDLIQYYSRQQESIGKPRIKNLYDY